MIKYGQIYLQFIHRPAKTEYEIGQLAWVPLQEGRKYIAAGQAEEMDPANLPKKAKEPEPVPTVDEIREAIPGLSIDELQELLEREKAGKNRKTAVEAIEERLAELEPTETPNEE